MQRHHDREGRLRFPCGPLRGPSLLQGRFEAGHAEAAGDGGRLVEQPGCLAAVTRAAAAAAGLIISHGTFLHREDFLCHVETAACISDGTPMAWIDWDAVIAALDGGRLPASGGEKRIVRIAASLAAGHQVSLRGVIPGLDRQSL